MTTSTHDLTRLLRAWSAGDHAAGDVLMPRVYGALKEAAVRAFRREGRGHTLQPTALVHEAYLRLTGQRTPWRDRGHFLALAATMMRRILLDHARRAGREKRGGNAAEVPFESIADLHSPSASADDLAALDEAIEALAALAPRKASVVTLHLFAGLSVEETATALGVSAATVSRDWRFARAWLAERLRGAAGSRTAQA